MLQWMGGSRRKVTTSRKSTHKRQKQYFQQRRRQQQQQNAGFDGYEEGATNMDGRICREHRSLDILSLLNVPSKNASTNAATLKGKEAGSSNVSVECVIRKDPLINPADRDLVDSLGIKEASRSSGDQMETTAPKKNSYKFSDSDGRAVNGFEDEAHLQQSCPHTYNNAFYKTDSGSKLLDSTAHQKLSVFDLLVGEGSNGNSGGNAAHEAHVAFSVEGLGKVGAETPVQSPQQPTRPVAHGCFSPLMATKQSYSSKNLNLVLDGFEIEVDTIMQDIDLPQSGSSLMFPEEIDYLYTELNRSSSPPRDYMQWKLHKPKTRTLSHDDWIDEKYYWNSSVDADFFGEMEPLMFQKSWLYPNFGDYADFPNNENNGTYAFQVPDWWKNRGSPKVVEFNTSELHGLKHQTAETSNGSVTVEGKRHHTAATTLDLRSDTNQPDWSCLVAKDARDTLSYSSEESCSSAAVRSKVGNMSLPNSTSGQNGRVQKVFHGSEVKSGPAIIWPKERYFNNLGDVWEAKVCRPGEPTWEPAVTKSRSTNKLSCSFPGKVEVYRDWPLEEGCKSGYLHFDPACQNSERKRPFSDLQWWTDGIGEYLVSEPCKDAKYSSDNIEPGSSVAYSHYRSCVSEKFVCDESSGGHRTPTFSQLEYEASKPDFCSDFELEGRLPLSGGDATLQGENLTSNLLAEQRVGGHKKDESELKESNCEGAMACKTKVKLKETSHSPHGPEFCDGFDGSLETSSSMKITDKCDSSVHKEDFDHCAEVPLHSQEGNEVNTSEGLAERKMTSKTNVSCLDASPPVMMLGSCSLQLLCVQKVPKEAYLSTP